MIVMYAFSQVLKRAAQSIAPAKPKVAPLYVQRKLTPESAAAFIEHFKAQGFTKVLAPEELHVTIVFSKEPVDWEALEPDDTELVVPPGTRKVLPLGDKGAVVMSFKSERLEARHRAWELSGASWDYDSYTPHLTITYRNPPEDLKAVKPFPGELEFGPEIMEPINDSYAADVVEKHEFLGVLKSEKPNVQFAEILKANPYHDSDGKFSTKDADADGKASLPLRKWQKDALDKLSTYEDWGDDDQIISTDKFFKGGVNQGAQFVVPKNQYSGEAVPMSRLVASQEGVHRANVEYQIKNPIRKEPITAVELPDGSIVIQDGHHGVVKDMMIGKSNVFLQLAKAKTYDPDTQTVTFEAKKIEFAQVLKENPYHDATGRFSTRDNDADGVTKPKDHSGLKHVKGLGWTKDGQGVDAELAGRMKALKVPPAWTDVWVSGDHTASLQATGRDIAGRKQYLYSKEHSKKSTADKFARLQEFQGQVKKIRENIQKELRERGDDSVAVLRLIERTGIRIGSDAETGAKVKAYGATTLLGKHVVLSGGQVKLDFIGKHGHQNTRDFYDKDLADYIRKKNPGPEDRVFGTNDARVRDRMKVIADPKFSPKDFRTWHGTAQALKALQDMPEPKNEKEREAQRKAVAKHVAAYLNNTPAVALESYIDPTVFDRPRGVIQKSEDPEDLDALMDNFVETTQFDHPGNPDEAPEPEDD